jgi:hypothetical protein
MRKSEAPVLMQRRLQHLLLLALRIAVLVLLSLAFAEPLLETDAPLAGEAKAPDQIVVIDNSLSMSAQRDGRSALQRAKADARAMIAALPFGTKAAVVSANQGLELVTPLTAERTELEAAIASISAASARLSFDGFGGRLATVAGALADPGEPLQLHVWSDFQASSMPDQFNALVENSVYPLSLHEVGGGSANWAVQTVNLLEDQSLVQATIVAHDAEPRAVPVAVYRGDRNVGTMDVVVDERATIEFPVDLATRESRVWRVEIDVDDALGADDARFVAKPVASAQPLPVLAADGRSYAYVAAATSAALPRYTASLERMLVDPPPPVTVVIDPGRLDSELEARLDAYLDDGGTVLMTAGPNTRAAGGFALIDTPLDGARMAAEGNFGVVPVDRSHPVLGGFSGWQNSKVYQSVRFMGEAPGNTILALDDGSPFLVELRVGAGRMLVLTTALSPEWSSLVVQPAFVTFMANAVNYLAEELLPSAATVGQPFAIPASSLQIFDDDGGRVLGLGDTVDRPAVRLDAPGIYEVRTPTRTQPLAVNLDGRESELAPASPDLLNAWQDATLASSSLQDAAERAKKGLAAEDVVQELALAPWLLLALLIVVLSECLVANLLTRRTQEAVA